MQIVIELHTDTPLLTGQSESVLHELELSTSQYPHVATVGPGPGAGNVPSEIHLP